MQGIIICSVHQQKVKQLCSNMQCQFEQKFLCEKCIQNNEHSECKQLEKLLEVEQFEVYAQKQKEVSENLFMCAEHLIQIQKQVEQKKKFLLAETEKNFDCTQKIEHFEKFGSAQKWDQLIKDDLFQEQNLSDKLRKLESLNDKLNKLSQYNQLWSKQPEEQQYIGIQENQNLTQLSKQKIKFDNIITQQMNNIQQESEQLQTKSSQQQENSSLIQQNSEQNNIKETDAVDQNLDDKLNEQSPDPQDNQINQSIIDQQQEQNGNQKMFELIFETSILKEPQFLFALRNGKLMVIYHLKIQILEESEKEGEEFKQIKQFSLESKIDSATVQGNVAIILTRDLNVHLIDCEKSIAKIKINGKQDLIAFSEYIQKLLIFEQNTNHLKRYYLNNKLLKFEQEKAIKVSNHAVSIQVLLNSVFVCQFNGTLEKFDINTFKNQFTYISNLKDLKVVQFFVSDSCVFLITSRNIIIKNHKNELIANLTQTDIIDQLVFQQTANSLILIYSRVEKNGLQLIQLSHSGIEQRKQLILKNQKISQQQFQQTSPIPYLYVTISKKIRKYQINC